MTPNFENPTPDDVVGLKPEDVTPVESSEMEETEESTKTEQQTEEVEDIFSDSLDQGSLKDLIEYLNKARQDNAEIEKVYRHVLGTATLTAGEHPDVLPVRPELATRFGIGNKGDAVSESPYTSTHTAAHDLVEYLANSAEKKLIQLETKDREDREVVERKEKARSHRDLIEYLNKARQDNAEVEKVYRHVLGTATLTEGEHPDVLPVRPELATRFGIGNKGDAVSESPYTSMHSASHDLVEFLVEEAENKIREIENEGRVQLETITPAPEPEPTPEPLPVTPEAIKPKEEKSVEKTRSSYLRAKRLFGNVFRGRLGRLFNRTLEHNDNEVDFGGEQGVLDLEEIRHDYQRELFIERTNNLQPFVGGLEAQLSSGEITKEEFDLKIREHILGEIHKEQGLIDKESVEGIERNRLEKLKVFWRQHTKSRIAVGVGLGVAAATGVGGAAVVVGRAAMGAAGTYTGVEAGLERFTEVLGHKGLIQQINKELPPVVKRPHYAERDLMRHDAILARSLKKSVESIPDEEIKKEAARLRMLQVEKGMSVGDVAEMYGNRNAQIGKLILERDDQIALDNVTKGINMEGSPLEYHQILSNRLSVELNERNKITESDIDKERVKKIFRKTIAAIAGAAVGWAILRPGPTPEPAPKPTPEPIPSPTPEPIPITPEPIPYSVQDGDVLWKIIESDIGNKGLLNGLTEGARTHAIDSLKDAFDKLDPDSLKALGFTSGDADVIFKGNELMLSGVLDNTAFVTKSLVEAGKLSVGELQEIVSNNREIASWLTAHRSELKSVYDSQMIDQVLRGQI